MTDPSAPTPPPGAPHPPLPPSGGGAVVPAGTGRRRWIVAGVAVAVVAVAVVATRGDGASGGGCLPDLARLVPADTELVGGSDYDRARAAGLDLVTVEDLADAVTDVNLRLDLLTNNRRVRFAEPSSVGYQPGDVDCWVGDEIERFVARGSFDEEAVTSSELGEGKVVVSGDVLAFDADGDPESLAEEPAGDESLVELVEEFDDQDAVSFTGIRMGDDGEEVEAGSPLWVALGIASAAPDWDFVAVWSFADAAEARGSRDHVVEAVAEGNVPSMIDGDLADVITVDGSMVRLRAPLTENPAQWIVPVQRFDKMFGGFDGWPGSGE